MVLEEFVGTKKREEIEESATKDSWKYQKERRVFVNNHKTFKTLSFIIFLLDYCIPFLDKGILDEPTRGSNPMNLKIEGFLLIGSIFHIFLISFYSILCLSSDG